MATPWASWLPDVLLHVPECPAPLVEHEVKRAAQALFRGSRAWIVSIPPLSVAANQEVVTVAPFDADQELVRVEAVWLDGRQLAIDSSDRLNGVFADDWRAHTGSPGAWLQETPGAVRLYPVPTDAAAVGLKCTLSVAPSEASSGLPDELAVRFRDAIACGARSRLMIQPGKPWSSPDGAMLYGGIFSDAVNSARFDALRSFGSARISSRVKWC